MVRYSRYFQEFEQSKQLALEQQEENYELHDWNCPSPFSALPSPHFTYRATFSLSFFQLHWSVGVTPHISYWNIPLETGDPSYVSYGPNFSANAHDASIDA